MKPFENYIQYLKRLQSNYEVGTGQHNVLGIAINEAEEALRQFAVSGRSEQLVCDSCIRMYENANGNIGLPYCKECEKLKQTVL